MDAYETLANAIIEQAVNDYRKYTYDIHNYSKRSKYYKIAAAEIPSLERFFKSK